MNSKQTNDFDKIAFDIEKRKQIIFQSADLQDMLNEDTLEELRQLKEENQRLKEEKCGMYSSNISIASEAAPNNDFIIQMLLKMEKEISEIKTTVGNMDLKFQLKYVQKKDFISKVHFVNPFPQYEILNNINFVKNKKIMNCVKCAITIQPNFGCLLSECLHCYCINCLVGIIENGTGRIICNFQVNDDKQCRNFLKFKETTFISKNGEASAIFEEKDLNGTENQLINASSKASGDSAFINIMDLPDFNDELVLNKENLLSKSPEITASSKEKLDIISNDIISLTNFLSSNNKSSNNQIETFPVQKNISSSNNNNNEKLPQQFPSSENEKINEFTDFNNFIQKCSSNKSSEKRIVTNDDINPNIDFNGKYLRPTLNSSDIIDVASIINDDNKLKQLTEETLTKKNHPFALPPPVQPKIITASQHGSTDVIPIGNNKCLNETSSSKLPSVKELSNISKNVVQNSNVNSEQTVVNKTINKASYLKLLTSKQNKIEPPKVESTNITTSINNKGAIPKNIIRTENKQVPNKKTDINSTNEVLEQIKSFKSQTNTSIFKCKKPNCNGIGLMDSDDTSNLFLCYQCKEYNCRECNAIHSGKTCKEYKNELNPSQSSAVLKKISTWKCTYCGNINSDSSVNCISCQRDKIIPQTSNNIHGNNVNAIETIKASVVPAPPNKLPDNKWACKHCTYINPSKNKYCFQCFQDNNNSELIMFNCQKNGCDGAWSHNYKVLKMECPKCKTFNCTQCVAIHPNMNCKFYQQQLRTRTPPKIIDNQTICPKCQLERKFNETTKSFDCFYCQSQNGQKGFTSKQYDNPRGRGRGGNRGNRGNRNTRK